MLIIGLKDKILRSKRDVVLPLEVVIRNPFVMQKYNGLNVLTFNNRLFHDDFTAKLDSNNKSVINASTANFIINPTLPKDYCKLPYTQWECFNIIDKVNNSDVGTIVWNIDDNNSMVTLTLYISDQVIREGFVLEILCHFIVVLLLKLHKLKKDAAEMLLQVKFMLPLRIDLEMEITSVCKMLFLQRNETVAYSYSAPLSVFKNAINKNRVLLCQAKAVQAMTIGASAFMVPMGPPPPKKSSMGPPTTGKRGRQEQVSSDNEALSKKNRPS